MNKTIRTIAAAGLVGSLLAPVALFAQTSADVNAAAVVKASTFTLSASAMAAAKAKADQEIDRRVVALTALAARIQAMQKVTDAFKQSLTTNVQAQITAFSQLKVKIDADTDAPALKADIESVTQSYRVYALFIPQGHIAAAADRAVTIATMMTTLGTKLQARIATEQSAGKDVTALTAALSDLGTKLSDAGTQAQTAVSISASLTPDAGDKTKMAANLAALKTARADIATAQKDLEVSVKDIATIIAGLKKLEVTTAATSTATTTRP